MTDKYIAFKREHWDFEFFETFEAAKEWLLDVEDYSEGYSSEFEQGGHIIAKITHRSSVKKTDEKENYPCVKGIREKYCENPDRECPDDCDGEEWPYSGEWEWVGDPEMIEV